MSGSSRPTKYLLDSNPFIEAKNRYYGFEICPGFWMALIDQFHKGRLCSIDQVHSELTAQSDQLSEWVETNCSDGFFKKTEDQAVVDCFQDMINWVYGQPFNQAAKTEFASVADGWVMAFAKVNGLTVVTHEVYTPNAIKKVPMPNVCIEFGIDYLDTFSMLEELSVKLILNTKRRR